MALVLAFKSAGAPKVLELQGVEVIFVTRFYAPFLVFLTPPCTEKSTWTLMCTTAFKIVFGLPNGRRHHKRDGNMIREWEKYQFSCDGGIRPSR